MATTYIAFEKGGDYATPHALSVGLWQALICTVGGLILAIPTHLAYHFLSSRVRSLVRDVEWSGNEIMRYLLSEYVLSNDTKENKAKS
jgi:biopolymer transport protein ExbB